MRLGCGGYWMSERFAVKNAGGRSPRRLKPLGCLAGRDVVDRRIGYEERVDGGSTL